MTFCPPTVCNLSDVLRKMIEEIDYLDVNKRSLERFIINLLRWNKKIYNNFPKFVEEVSICKKKGKT